MAMSGRGYPRTKGGALPYDPDWMQKLGPAAPTVEPEAQLPPAPVQKSGSVIEPGEEAVPSNQPDWPRYGNK